MDRATLAKLTPRQRECLRLLAAGGEVKTIARDLGVSPNTVTKRLQDARTILGVSSSREAARMLIQADGYSEPISTPIYLADSGAPAPFNLPIGSEPSRTPTLWRLLWPVPTREHPSNDLSTSERIQSSLLLACLIIIGSAIVLTAIVLLLQVLSALAQHGSYGAN